ncbi:MAG: Lrp/AsnC family transcriptional regulator, partial [Bacteroidetes bacterium]|nr:Lrp/AsnC family transcriptional regulator [Bacteroidota bacterium]
VQVDGSENYPNFVAQTHLEPEILECHSITGEGSHLLKVRTKNTSSFERLLSKIQSWEGVDKTRSNLVLSSFKETRSLPIEQSTELMKS